MANPGFEVEEGPDGRTLVVTGRWSTEAARVLERREADGLLLNHAHGFSEGSLELLDSDWPILRLGVLDRSIEDLDPISRLSGLERLSIQVAANAELDLAQLPRLTSVGGEWGLIGRTLSALTELQIASTWAFDESDLHAFRDHFALRQLTIKDAPHLEALTGIGELADLETLTVRGARNLSDIQEVGQLASSLRELVLEDCSAIETIDVVESLVGLTFLEIGDLGDIASLAPLSSLSQLEKLYAWGSTRILDEDLSPLQRLPRLAEVRMRNRREYSPQVTELDAAVS